MPRKTPQNRRPGIDEASDPDEKQRAKSANHRDCKSSKLAIIYAPYALLIIAVLLAYANVYHNDFLYDDIGLIRNNKFLTSWRYISTFFVTPLTQGSFRLSNQQYEPFYRPLQLMLYLFVYQIAGLSTVAFHLLNVTLHALNACLLYTLGIRLGFQRIGTFLATLLWAVHPVHTEAVTYVNGTAELLYGAFLLAGILVLVPGFSSRRVLAACLLFTLGLLSKESAVVFPVLVMGLLFYQSENRWSLRTYLKTWPLWLMTVLYFVARETVLNFNGFLGFYNAGLITKATIGDRFCTFLATLPTYLRLLVWPTCLHMERSFPIYTSLWASQAIAGLAILTALFIGIVWKPARRATPLAWGILWAGALFIPVSGVLVPNDALISENWLYLPTAGFALGLGEILARISAHFRMLHIRPVLAGLAVVIACLLAVTTLEQNKVWRDSIVLYNHVLICGDDSARIRHNLGVAYSERGQYELAIRQYRLTLVLSDDAEDHYLLGANLVNIYYDNPPLRAEGMAHLHRALELNPDHYRAAVALAQMYAYVGDHEKESEYLARAAAIRKKLGID